MVELLRKPGETRPSGIALTAVQHQGLTELAIQEGHLSRSRVVKRLIETELAAKFGQEWEDRFDPASNRLANADPGASVASMVAS